MLDILIIVGDRVFHLPNPRDEGPWERGCIGGWHVRKYTERSNKMQVAGCRLQVRISLTHDRNARAFFVVMFSCQKRRLLTSNKVHF